MTRLDALFSKQGLQNVDVSSYHSELCLQMDTLMTIAANVTISQEPLVQQESAQPFVEVFEAHANDKEKGFRQVITLLQEPNVCCTDFILYFGRMRITQLYMRS